jgi:LacI family transcriptional regulator
MIDFIMANDRPTLADVAARAGVGVATVDRVLNRRAAVREETARRVVEAAEALGYHATRLLKARLEQRRPRRRLAFVLQRPEQPFYQAFAAALARATAEATEVQAEASVSFVSSQAPADVVAALRAASAEADAVAMVATDHPAISLAVGEATERGKPVVALLSDFATGLRQGYLGTDNRKAGRTSGWLLARSMLGHGRAAIFVGSHRFDGHELRETGCRSYLRAAFPGIDIVETQTSFEDAGLAREALLDLLGRYPDLSGIYVAGGGIEGGIAALREETRPGQVAVVANELTPVTRPALLEGYVSALIGTPIEPLSRRAVAEMSAFGGDGATRPPAEIFLPFDIFVAENV